jgi:hypothetical protein
MKPDRRRAIHQTKGPVVLVHGDSHYFRIDKPMTGTRSRRRVENFTGRETFGENHNHWLHVTVEPTSPNVFLFDQRIVAANLIAREDRALIRRLRLGVSAIQPACVHKRSASCGFRLQAEGDNGPFRLRQPEVSAAFLARPLVKPARLRAVTATPHRAPAPSPVATGVEKQPATSFTAALVDLRAAVRRQQFGGGQHDRPEHRVEGIALFVGPTPDEGRPAELEAPAFQGCGEEHVEPAHIAGC